MKIIAFMRGYKPYFNTGAILMTSEILEALVLDGHKVTVYSMNDEPDREENGVVVKHFNKLERPDLGKYDAVITHPDLGSIGPKTVTEKYAPLIGIVHNTMQSTLDAIERHHMRYNLMVYNSQSTAKFFDEFPGIVLHSPLDVERYKVARRGAKYITLINQSGAKGVELMWKLAWRMPEYKFLAVEGPYNRQHIRDDIPNVTNMKFVDHEDVSQVYARTRVLLTPSSHESWGRVAAEAMCSGIPVVSSNVPGLREAVGPSGVFLDRSDVEAWEKELRALMDDQTYYRTRSSQARTRALEIEKLSQSELQFFVDNFESLCRK
jgi:glycosyltransferase involved in cell wall biosynthesis